MDVFKATICLLIQAADRGGTEVSQRGTASQRDLCSLRTQNSALRDPILALSKIIKGYHIYPVNGVDLLFVYNNLGPSCIDVFYGM